MTNSVSLAAFNKISQTNTESRIKSLIVLMAGDNH